MNTTFFHQELKFTPDTRTAQDRGVNYRKWQVIDEHGDTRYFVIPARATKAEIIKMGLNRFGR